MNSFRKVALALALLLPGVVFAAHVESEVQVETKALRAAPQAPKAHHATPVDLAAPSDAERKLTAGYPKKGEPPRIGFGRDVAALGNEATSAAKLAWETTSTGGKVAAIAISSPEAAALRLGIRVKSLPETAILRFHATGSTETVEAKGSDVLEALAQNLEAGETGASAELWWSPPIEGSSATMEIEIPAGIDTKQVRIAVPQVSHLTASASNDFVDVYTKASATCENDAMCVQSTWGAQMNAVARMVFTSGGSSYLCTGTLLADQDTSTQIPYFLSANHCINTQSSASSLVTYWFYRSSSCNSGTAGTYQTLTGGATLLYNSTATDTSFMRLNTTPPSGAVYAGWTTDVSVGPGTAIGALHHPKGDLLKYSSGSIDAYLSCTPPSSTGTFSCSLSNASAGGFYDIVWSSGTVEGGSSGSGLFLQNGRYLVGQLYGGSSTCTDLQAGDTYGRFDFAYNTALSQWLGGTGAAGGSTSPPIALSVTTAGSGTGTITSSPAGISCPGTCTANFPQGTAVALTASPGTVSRFAGWSGACTNATGSCIVTLNAASTASATFNYAGASWPPSVTSMPLGYVNTGSGWMAITGTAGVDTYEGGTAMKTNATPDGGSANLTYVATFNAGTVTFARRVSSASTAFLRVYLDTSLVGQWSGEVPWGLVSFPITSGSHTLQFVYDKTNATAGGSDNAWLDALNFPPNTPSIQQVAVTLAGNGTGLVTSSPAGLSCGDICLYSVTTGAPVTLTASDLPGSRFAGWGGACSFAGGANDCSQRASSSLAAIATFTAYAGTHKKALASQGGPR